MNRFSAFLVLVCSTACLAQAPQIKSGSAVYIEQMGGYETYLAAALVKKHIPLVIVTDKDKADCIIQSSVNHTTPSQPAVVVKNTNINNIAVNGSSVKSSGSSAYADMLAESRALGSTSTSIVVVDSHSSQIIFADTEGKSGINQLQKTAESCAKHLKEFIEKSEKPRK